MELLNEDGITLDSLRHDIETLRQGFAQGKKLGIVIISEGASPHYDTEFVRRIMEAESGGQFEVRQTILGHLQRGGAPTAFDRVQGSRLGAHAARQIMQDIESGNRHQCDRHRAPRCGRDPVQGSHADDGLGVRPAEGAELPAVARFGRYTGKTGTERRTVRPKRTSQH
jgi:hypothetical protein